MLELVEDPDRQADGGSGIAIERPTERERSARKSARPQRGDFDIEGADFLSVDMFRMHFHRGMKGEHVRAAESLPAPILLAISAAADEAKIGPFVAMAGQVGAGRVARLG